MAKTARITGLTHLEQFTISKTENVSCVIPQRNIKVLNNDLLMTSTDTVTRYYTEKFPSLEEIFISNFVSEKNALSRKALDDFFHHIARNVKHYHIRTRSAYAHHYWRAASTAVCSIKAGAPYVDNMHVLIENSSEDYANSYAEIRNHLLFGVKRHGNFCDGGTRICMVKTCFSRSSIDKFRLLQLHKEILE